MVKLDSLGRLNGLAGRLDLLICYAFILETLKKKRKEKKPLQNTFDEPLQNTFDDREESVKKVPIRLLRHHFRRNHDGGNFREYSLPSPDRKIR